MERHALASDKRYKSRSIPHDVIPEIPASRKRYKYSSFPHDVIPEIPASRKRYKCSSIPHDVIPEIPASVKRYKNRSIPHDVIAEIPASKKRYKRRSIPHDLMFEILSRIPGRSLVRFRCVSKFWYSLFRDPHFVGLQLNQATKNPSYFVGYLGSASQFLDQISFYSFEMESGKIAAGSKFSVPVPVVGIRQCILSNPCNGLIAFHRCVYSYVANPFTREWVALPEGSPHTYSAGDSWFGQPSVGLGFSTATREYKLVRFFFSFHEDATYSSWACEVLTLGTDRSWRLLGDVPFCVTKFAPAYGNGCLCWTIETDDRPESIISFDVCREEFKGIRLPHCLHLEPDGFYRKLCMRVLEGSVCLIDSRVYWDEEKLHICPVIHIHVMEEEGGSLVWSEKSHIIRLGSVNHRSILTAKIAIPIDIQNGIVFLHRADAKLVLYDLKTGTATEIKFRFDRKKLKCMVMGKPFACAESITPAIGCPRN